MLLVIDNGTADKLVRALKRCKIPHHVYDASTDELVGNELVTGKQKQKVNVRGAILSGGAMKLSTPVKLEAIAPNLRVLASSFPVLGICFGCQVMHTVYGGKMRDLGKYVCTDIDVTFAPQPLLLAGCGGDPLRFCFSDMMLTPPDTVQVQQLAWFKFRGKEVPCAFRFSDAHYGVLFHPEHHEASHVVLRNFAKMCKVK